jgi:hypothetical protein
MVVSVVLVLLTRFTYRRRDEDERKRIEKEQNQTINHHSLNQPINDIINEQQHYGTFD